MAKITFQDNNKKNFSIEQSEIFNFTTDSKDEKTSESFSDSSKVDQRVQPVKIKYMFSDGVETTQENALNLLKDQDSAAERVIALDIELEATHSGPNDNDCIYYEDSMEADSATFMSPYAKPMLKNHNSYDGEPLGRIKAFSTSPSVIALDRTAINLTARITDQDAIEKFLDGRYQTFSIAGTMGHVTCGICGKNILKDGVFKFCGHWRGETYNNKVCQWGVRDIRYNECSVVNNPADKYAQVTKITVVTDGCKKKKTNDSKQEDQKMDGDGKTPETKTEDANKSKLDEIFDFVQSLKMKQNTPEVPEDKKAEDSEKPEAGKPEDKPEEKPTTTDSNSENGENQKLADEVKELKQKLEDAEKREKDAVAAKEASEIKLGESEKEVERLRDNLTTISEYSKGLIVDFIIKEENVKDDEVEKRKTELMAKSTKELGALKDSCFEKQKVRTPGSVKSPALANGVNDEETKAPGETKVADSNKKTKTKVQSIVDGIVGL